MYVSCYFWYWLVQLIAFSALTLLVGPQEEHPAWPVKIEWWGVGVVICLEWGADRLHIVQLMPLHLKSPSSLAYLNPDWFYLSGTCLPRFPYHFIFSGQLLFLAPNQQCCKCFSWLDDEFTEWCAFLAFPVSAHFLCCYFCGRRNLIGRSVGRSIDWLINWCWHWAVHWQHIVHRSWALQLLIVTASLRVCLSVDRWFLQI